MEYIDLRKTLSIKLCKYLQIESFTQIKETKSFRMKAKSPESLILSGDSHIYFFLAFAFWLATTTLLAFSSTERIFFLSSRICFMSSAL